MSTLVDVTKFATEQRLAIPTAGSGIDCVVISGYAYPNYGDLTGSPDSDYKTVNYTVLMTVGPAWTSIRDVSPIVTPAGFHHKSSDEADATGYEVKNCIWKKVPGQAAGTERIQLEVEVTSSGGPDADLTVLAYHLVANGRLEPGAKI